MHVKDARESYHYNSGKAGDIARQLALAGIAVVWMFREGMPGGPYFTHTLLLALAWFGAALTLDFLQYLSGTMLWSAIAWIKEQQLKRQGIDPDSSAGKFEVWHSANWPCLFFMYAKFAALTIGAVFMAQHLLWQIVDS